MASNVPLCGLCSNRPPQSRSRFTSPLSLVYHFDYRGNGEIHRPSNFRPWIARFKRQIYDTATQWESLILYWGFRHTGVPFVRFEERPTEWSGIRMETLIRNFIEGFKLHIMVNIVNSRPKCPKIYHMSLAIVRVSKWGVFFQIISANKSFQEWLNVLTYLTDSISWAIYWQK